VDDPEGSPPLYLVDVYDKNGLKVESFSTAGTAATVEDLVPGNSYTFTVTAVNQHRPENASTASATSAPVRSLDPLGDEDGDGASSAAEVMAGTDPLDPGSVLRAKMVRAGNNYRIEWKAVSGRTYRIETRPGFSSGTWQTLPGATGLQSGAYEVPMAGGSGFFRVVVEGG
jgi:hypothetical protein